MVAPELTRSRIGRILGLFAVLVVFLSGCGGATTADAGGGPSPIRVALDWTPNTNHTGLFVAQQRGWFRDAGLDVQFLPYSGTSPDTLVSSGAAEFGISFQDSFSVSKAAGADITSVMAILQHWASEIAVRADRTDINSPKDLDGKVYGGFGGPGEEAKMRAVIRNAGGRGEFDTVVLGTSAYEALYAGKVDFAEPFVAWEGIEAQLRGQPLTTFAYADYGFPDAYSVLLIGNGPWLAEHPQQARAFVQATQRGYQFGADDPSAAGRLLMDANPGAFTEPELVERSQQMLSQRYLRDASGRVGTQTLAQWAGFSGFLYDAGILADSAGKPLTTRPDFATWFTDEYLAAP
ncbi:ABC transporter substrate-binding protein [Pseudonocardia asaccharolytica]|uniref:Thiamine pyrimidine synthase n=1 Tax=Pseudonocardia asaccharolytica DSM 44247 = NBRC 16224 TaxID=1123024 RepID=A0A511D6R6_9PSEU|nr:ABC transporter substrate-binding protein [Pseudonocardia asaccharolytica]GEL20480.1 myristoyl transferase [Pseudonocardia asaccharolytica DSM 44247 = NBRC 16224]